MTCLSNLMYFVSSLLIVSNSGREGTFIKYSNCGPNTLLNVDLMPCTIEPCTFKKGTNATVTIDFTTLEESEVTAITTEVFGIVAGIPVPYNLPNTDGCNGCNLECPLSPGPHKYINVLPVLQSYPDIRLVVKWQLVNQNKELLVCFLFPMAITDEI